MTRYLISFPSGAMDDIPEEEMPAVGDAAHAVVRRLPQTKELSGGLTVIDVPSREAALERAARIAVACRCAQEVRAFGFDPLV